MGCIRPEDFSVDDLLRHVTVLKGSYSMAKKRVAAKRVGATKGVPSLETVHDCREKKVMPPVILVGINIEDYEEDEYDEEDRDSDFWSDVSHIGGFYHTEGEAIEAAKKKFENYGTTYEWRIFHMGKMIRISRPEPVVEVV